VVTLVSVYCGHPSTSTAAIFVSTRLGRLEEVACCAIQPMCLPWRIPNRVPLVGIQPRTLRLGIAKARDCDLQLTRLEGCS